MANNIEFVPASELPMAETDDIEVLCIENGELKLKDGSGLGGSGEFDAVLRSTSYPCNHSTDVWTVEKLDFEGIKSKILAGEMATAKIIHDYNYGDNYIEVCTATAFQYEPDYDTITIIYPSYTGRSGYRHISGITIDSSGSVIHYVGDYC